MTYSPEQLTNLLTTDKAELTRICAEVCEPNGLVNNYRDNDGNWIANENSRLHTASGIVDFQPLENTVKGRSHAFELAVKFHCFPIWWKGAWAMALPYPSKITFINNDPQSAIVIASILTAQELIK